MMNVSCWMERFLFLSLISIETVEVAGALIVLL